jgi:hypothetical protein
MAWLRGGTVAVTNGSTTVVGTNADFVANSRVGDGFIGPDGFNYEIGNVASATAISIIPAYKGVTASGVAYAIMPVQGYPKTLADAFNNINLQWGVKLAALGTTGNYDVLPVAKGGTGGTTALGTAAFLTATTSNTDPTVGRALKVGDLGVGVPLGLTSPNLNSLTSSGTYYCDTPTNSPGNASGWLTVTSISATYASQTFNALTTGIKYWRELVGGIWGKWDAVYSSRNAVGTVSQTGGLPTGALMEYVTNSSGEAWKYANGLLVCSRYVSTPISFNIPPGTAGTGGVFPLPVTPIGTGVRFYNGYATDAGTSIVGSSWIDASFGALNWKFQVSNLSASITITQLIAIQLLYVGRWF